MHNLIETLNRAIFNNIKVPFLLIVTVFIVLIVITSVLVFREIKNQEK